MRPYESWGRYPRSEPARIVELSWASEVPDLNRLSRPVLPYGKGRSYGDCCLNDGGTLLDALGLDRFIRFDRETGLLRCEAGVTLQTVLEVIVPANWFLPVTPGTQFVTVGVQLRMTFMERITIGQAPLDVTCSDWNCCVPTEGRCVFAGVQSRSV